MLRPRTWQETLVRVPDDAEFVASCRPLWQRELDAQGLLCPRCGMRRGTGVRLVERGGKVSVQPCPECALWLVEQRSKT